MDFLTNITMYLKGLGKQKQQQSQKKEKWFSKNYTDGRRSFHIHRLAEYRAYVHSTKSSLMSQYNPHQYIHTQNWEKTQINTEAWRTRIAKEIKVKKNNGRSIMIPKFKIN